MRLTAIVRRFFIANSHHYDTALKIACGATPEVRLRQYYEMVAKVRNSDELTRAALDMVDWKALAVELDS